MNIKQLEQRIEQLTTEQSEKMAELTSLRQRLGEAEAEYSQMLRAYDLGDDGAANAVEALRLERTELKHQIATLQSIVVEYPQRLQMVQDELETLGYRDRLADLATKRQEVLEAATAYQQAVQVVLESYDAVRAAVTTHNIEHQRLSQVAQRTGRSLPNRLISPSVVLLMNGEWFSMPLRRQAGLKLLEGMCAKLEA